MGRPARFDVEGGWHHVMNRGAGHQQVFFTRSDGEAFEMLLDAGHVRFGVEVHAYCLVRNHFHLLLHCPNGAMAAFMQYVGSGYTRILNQRLGRDGPIFRARFRSIPIDSPEYQCWVGRYIHRNALDTRPPVPVDQYRWSSMRYYARPVEPPRWMRTDTLLSMFGNDRAAYTAFVDEPRTGRPATDAAIVVAAIEMLVDERVDASPSECRGVARTIAFGMLDRCDDSLRAALEELLTFPTAGARRVARHRANQALRASPELRSIVATALDLAA